MSDPTPAAPGDKAPIDPAILKSALKAFRKRLKLTRLDDESGIGARAMTSGQKSGRLGVVPPNQFPHEVWEELARQGKIKSLGRGAYELIGE